MWIDVLVYLCL